MDIQIEICATLGDLVRRRTKLEAPPINSVVLYQTTDINGETGSIVLQNYASATSTLPVPIGQPTNYTGKFILVVRN